MHADSSCLGWCMAVALSVTASWCRRLGDGEFNPGDLWMGRYSDYAEYGGVRIPQRMECIWVLHNGATPCPYADLSITDYRCFTRIGRTSMAGCT